MKTKTKKNKSAFTLIEMGIIVLVVALIVSMIANRANLVGVAKLSNLRSITASSPVYDIEGNTVWLDASAKDAFETYPQDGDSIDSWTDTSPYLDTNIAFTQATPANQPEFIYDSLDGLPALRFNGTTDILSSPSIPGYDLFKPDQTTIIFVQKINTASNNIVIQWDSGTKDDNLNSVTAYVIWTNNILYWYFGANNASGQGRIEHTLSNNDFDNEWRIISLVRKYNNKGRVRVNGIDEVADGNMLTDLDVSESSTLTIGKSANVDLREVIIFKKELTLEEIIDVENYLARKWQIEID